MVFLAAGCVQRWSRCWGNGCWQGSAVWGMHDGGWGGGAAGRAVVDPPPRAGAGPAALEVDVSALSPQLRASISNMMTAPPLPVLPPPRRSRPLPCPHSTPP